MKIIALAIIFIYIKTRMLRTYVPILYLFSSKRLEVDERYRCVEAILSLISKLLGIFSEIIYSGVLLNLFVS